MARQAEAEREKRAKIIAAEGESAAAAALGEASDTVMRHPLALQLRNLQSLVEIGVDDRSLAWATSLARREGRAITVLHATGSTPSVFGSRPEPAAAAAPHSLRADGRQVTSRARWTLRRDDFEGPVHESRVASSPVAALTEASRTAALVVVGTHGRGALGMFVLGSVSRGLVGRVRCPLVVVPPPAEADGTGAGSPDVEPAGGVLVAVDEHRPGRAALDFALGAGGTARWAADGPALRADTRR